MPFVINPDETKHELIMRFFEYQMQSYKNNPDNASNILSETVTVLRHIKNMD